MKLKPSIRKSLELGIFLSLTATLVLSGCGGGGSSSNAPAAPPVATSTVTGVAAAGLISHAKASIFKSTDVVTPLKSMTTGANGVYSFDVPSNTGAIIVKIEPIAAASGVVGSTMLDERTGLSSPFTKTMRTALPALVAGTNQAHATPFTEAMVKSVEADPTPAKLIAAKQSIMTITGADPVITPPVHVVGASTTELAQTAVMVDKLARFNDAAENDATCGIVAIATATLGDRVDCLATKMGTAMVVSGSSITPNSTTLGPILTNMNNAVLPPTLFAKKVELSAASNAPAPVDAPALTVSEKATVTISITQLGTVTNQANSPSGLASVTAPTNTAIAGVATAKAFFKNLRTSLNLYSNSTNTGLLDKQATRISNDLNALIVPDVQAINDVALAISHGQQLYQEVVEGTWESNFQNKLGKPDFAVDGITPTQVRVVKNVVQYGPFGPINTFTCKTSRYKGSTAADVTPANLGTLATSSPAGDSGTWTPVVYDPLTGAYISGGDFTSSTSVPVVNWEAFSAGLVVRCDGPSRSTYNYLDGSSVTDYVQITLIPATNWSAINPSFTYKADKWQMIGYADGSGSDTSVSSAPYMSGAITANSNGTATVAATNMSVTVAGDFPSLTPGAFKEHVAINFAYVEPTATTSRVDFSGSFASYNQANALLSSIGIGQGSYVTQVTTTYAWGKTQDATDMHLVLEASGPATKFTGTLDASAFMNDATGYGRSPTVASFTGTISDTSTGGAGVFLTGKLDSNITGYSSYNPWLAPSATNYKKQSVTFTGTTSFAGQSPLVIVFGNTQTGPNSFTSDVSLTYASGKVISGKLTNTNGVDAATSLTDTGGVSVAIPSGNLNITNDIKVGNEVVGSITNGIISYRDLTVESLN